jgi:translocator protein
VKSIELKEDPLLLGLRPKKYKMKNAFKLTISILLCQGAGIAGSLFTKQSVSTWYVGLEKPVFSPPNSVFGPVWIFLYLTMGFSMFLVWRKGLDSINAKRAFALFIFHLFINSLWSFAFFGLRSPLAGIIVITVLLATIILIIIKFSRISRMASIILVPYMLWVSFAAVLNASIFMLNR